MSFATRKSSGPTTSGGRKKATLEPGGNAACIVDADPGRSKDDEVERLAFGACYRSRKSCVSVQRILVYRALRDSLAKKLSALGREGVRCAIEDMTETRLLDAAQLRRGAGAYLAGGGNAADGGAGRPNR